jgi:hypothetical protein
LVGFSAFAYWLQIQDFFYILSCKDVVTASNPFFKRKMMEE